MGARRVARLRVSALQVLAMVLSLAWPASLPAATSVPNPPSAIDLAGHSALYELTLERSRGDVTGATGTMSYEVVDACDGWAVHQRLLMTITNRDGQDIDMVSDYTTWESKDGKQLRFRMRQTTDQAVTTDVAGEAELEPGGGGEVRYTQPAGQTKPLAKGTLFPMAHTEAIIRAAMAGKRFIALPLFDGTGIDGAQDSTVAVAQWGGPEPGKWPALAELASGRVHVAFFDQSGTSQQPEYEVSMRYWANGVADDLLMDFGDFAMRGKLSTLTMQPKGC